MLDTESDQNTAGQDQPGPATTTTTSPTRTRRRAASRPAGPPEGSGSPPEEAAKAAAAAPATDSADAPPDREAAPVKKATAKKAGAKRTAKKTAGKKVAAGDASQAAGTAPIGEDLVGTAPAPDAGKKTARRRTTKRSPDPDQPGGFSPEAARLAAASDQAAIEPQAPDKPAALSEPQPTESTAQPGAVSVLFQPPDPQRATRKRSAKKAAVEPDVRSEEVHAEVPPVETTADDQVASSARARAESQTDDQVDSDTDDGPRRRRRRGGRRRRKSSAEPAGDSGSETTGQKADEVAAVVGAADETATPDERVGGVTAPADQDAPGVQAPAASNGDAGDSSRRRRRRRRRPDDEVEPSPDDPADTVVRVRKPRPPKTEITSVEGSTRLEAKKQRRREGREAGRRRAPIASEAEFLARRESVDRVMVIRQSHDVSQIAVLEDRVLVEHYVAREEQASIIGNVYLGRVQNVLPSMEAAFIDIGKGRNGVLYAGEVNWDLMGNGQPRKIESALKSGQSVLVQVTKDPVGHKGARLTSQISLPGRYLVYVPRGGSNGISRKLADTERSRLKALLKDILPEDAGVIIRTAAEGASEDELTRDVSRLTARWEDIEKKTKNGAVPALLYGEPDLTIKVVRDLFTEDFTKLVIDGDEAWEAVHGYVTHVAPELADRLERWSGTGDVFDSYRVDEQIEKGLDRKVWLPSGGSLVIDRTEAMTVVDVNTGKFTGSGGNLEETVTKNNLEAAEEVVRQLRLRDIGGIIVVDFIDMVLESNRDLVLRRLVECLGRDRTRHQVAEVTSLGLVQMTRKRIGTGLLEAFSEPCDRCGGRGLLIHHQPVVDKPEKPKGESKRSSRRSRDERPDVSGGSVARGAGEETTTDAEARHVDESHQDQVTEADPDTHAVTTAELALQPDTPGTPEGTGTDDQSPATPPRTLLDPVRDLDALPEAVTPRKRTRKRVTRPAGQPTRSG